MIRNGCVSLVFVWALLLGASGCGDASAAGSPCQQMCQSWEDCPGLTWGVDCLSICEEAVEDANALGGSCPALFDEVVECWTQLTCSEVYLRNTSGFYDDECVVKETAVAQCVPGEPATPDDELDEFSLACEALCEAIDDCPTLEANADCRETCVTQFTSFENGTELCTESLINDINCRAGLSCTALRNRITGSSVPDACGEADAIAEAACF